MTERNGEQPKPVNRGPSWRGRVHHDYEITDDPTDRMIAEGLIKTNRELPASDQIASLIREMPVHDDGLDAQNSNQMVSEGGPKQPGD